MYKFCLIIPLIICGALYGQSCSKNEMLKYYKPPVKSSIPDSVVKKKHSLSPRISKPDSIKLFGTKDFERRPPKNSMGPDIKSTMPMVKPDSNKIFNMPIVTPDPGRTYSMPVLPVPYNSDYHGKILYDKEKTKLKSKPLNKK